MNFNNFFQSKAFKRSVIVVGLLIVIFFSFSVGVFVGYRKARFSYEWSDNYDRNFGGPHHGIFGFGPFGLPPNGGFMSAHGTAGSVLSVDSASGTLAVSGLDNMEKTVIVLSSTILREDRNQIGFSDIEAGEPVVVIGTPNGEGQIEARLVRVLR